MIVMVAGVVVASGGRASASCVEASSLPAAVAEAKIAFVGTVVRTSNGRRFAQVSVDAVWKGSRIPRRVEVRGSTATTANARTSVDREYVTGRKYLFVPYQRPMRATFLDNACSATTEFTRSVGDAKP
jgi:hypothetical protein